jgi:hypothetical protein
MQAGEYDGLPTKFFDVFIVSIDDPSFFKIFVSEESIGDEQFLNGLHFDASEDLLLSVSDPIFIFLHNRVELFQNLLLADGFGVLHFAHYGGIG